ncbi:MAG: YxeA family protein [Clostridiales bacterium]|nr:YxeA family protein [Clostridiales bacterium]
MKKPVLWILIAIALVLVALVALWGKQYYENRYVGSDYYAMVPPDFDITPEMRHNMSGGEVGLGKIYKLTAYNEQGEAKTVEISVYVDRDTFPQPGDYLFIKASKQLVVGWKVTDKNNIPANVLAMIE